MVSFQREDCELESTSIKSKVKFQWDFHGELEKLMEVVEDVVRKEVIPNYWVEYTEFGTHSMKVKIKDKSLMIEKLVVCNFTYHKNDEKFWYIEPEFIISEKSQKTKKYSLWRFTITHTDEIIKAFIKKMIDVIEEF